jgi:hypothetical protein
MMRPSLLFAWATLALAALAAPAAADRFEIRLPGGLGVMLGVVGGEVRVVRTTANMDWELGGTTIRVLAPEKYEGKYLAYDPLAVGKEKGAVFLAGKPGDGTKWLRTRVKDKNESNLYTIQAASGKYKGWYLDYKDSRVILSEKPKEIPKWIISEIAP